MTKTISRIELERGCDLEEEGKFEQAFECYLRAARRGNVEAQVNLGNLYDDEKGCPRDPQQAVYWYKRAARSGCSSAAHNLWVHYRQCGKQRWARYWLERAAELGDEDARLEINSSDKGSG